MKCSDYVVWIAHRLDGSLTEREAEELEAHLVGCSRCRAEMALQKKLVHSLKQEIPVRLPGDFTRRVSQRAARLARQESRRFRLADLVRAVPVAAGLALLVIFSRDLAGIIAPAMESIAGAIGGPLAVFGESIAGPLSQSSAASGQGLPYAETLSRILANTYVGVTIACAAVAWAFSRAYAFVRQ